MRCLSRLTSLALFLNAIWIGGAIADTTESEQLFSLKLNPDWMMTLGGEGGHRYSRIREESRESLAIMEEDDLTPLPPSEEKIKFALSALQGLEKIALGAFEFSNIFTKFNDISFDRSSGCTFWRWSASYDRPDEVRVYALSLRWLWEDKMVTMDWFAERDVIGSRELSAVEQELLGSIKHQCSGQRGGAHE